MPVYSSREKNPPWTRLFDRGRLLIFEETSTLDVYSIVDVYFINDFVHIFQTGRLFHTGRLLIQKDFPPWTFIPSCPSIR